MASNDGEFILGPGENFVICPYNLAHNVTNARLIVHLDKCRRNYLKSMKEQGKSPDMKQCRFNWIHQVPAPEIEYHEAKCPDRGRVADTLRYHSSDSFKKSLEEDEKRKAATDKEEYDRHRQHRRHSHHDENGEKHKKKHSKKHDVKPQIDSLWGSDTEDWEAESKGYEPGYDPNVKLQNDIVLYHPRGLSKSERKTFREEQKQRAAYSSYDKEEVDVKPFSKLEMHEPKREAPKPVVSKPVPVVKSEPIKKWVPDEKEEGEISEEEFYGEDPFS